MGRQKFRRIVFLLAGFVLLPGCQTTMQGDTFGITKQEYSDSFDQGDHLRQLLDEDEFDRALHLFEVQEAFFAKQENRRANASSLLRLSEHYNTARRKSAQKALAQLQAVAWPSPVANWPEIKTAMDAAAALLYDYPSETLLADETYGLAAMREGRALLHQLRYQLIDGVQTAFDRYDHFGQPPFFLNYPYRLLPDDADAPLNAKSLAALRKQYPEFRYESLADKLKQAREDDLLHFATLYPDSTFFPEQVRSAYLRGVTRNRHAALERTGVANPTAYLMAVASALNAGYVKGTVQSDIAVYSLENRTAGSGASFFPVVIRNDIAPDEKDNRTGNIVSLALQRFRSGPARYLAIVDIPGGTVAETLLRTESVDSERPVKTDHYVNPKWIAAKAAFDEAERRYQEAGGDEEYGNPPTYSELPEYHYCHSGDAAACAIGTLIGAAIVSGIDSYKRQKFEEIVALRSARNDARAKLASLSRDLVRHTYGAYRFTRKQYGIARDARVRIALADKAAKRFTVLRYSLRTEKQIAVLIGFSESDKNLESHLQGALTENGFKAFKHGKLDIPLSKLIATFRQETIAAGRFEQPSELEPLLRRHLGQAAGLN